MRCTSCSAPCRRVDGSMTSAAPSGWRVGSGGGGATLSPTPPSQPTEVGALWGAVLWCSRCVCFHVVMTHVEQAVTEECYLPYIFPYPLLPPKLFFLPFLHSHLFLHDLTAERGVFWAGGHRSSSPAGWPEGAARKVAIAKVKRQKFQRQHKATLLCEKACASSRTGSSAQRGSVQYDLHNTSKQASLFRCSYCDTSAQQEQKTSCVGSKDPNYYYFFFHHILNFRHSFPHLPSTHRPRADWRTSAAGLLVPWMMRTFSPCSWGSRGDAWMSRGLNYHACCKPEMKNKNKLSDYPVM